MLRDHKCALMRHVAVLMLEFDICNAETVTLFLDEYKRTLYPETKELIVRKLGMSRDKRAVAAVDEAIKSKEAKLSKAAAEGKEYGQNQSCVPQEPAGKPYYGYMDVGDVCEGTEEGANVVGTPSGDSPKDKKSKGAESGGAESVNFGN
ncbi:MAG: hypothetical protein HY075_02170 [Deltaproteobacteria bacterium]|nr:hypothetical protein [Deltaproteobacteria bacterium]